MWGLLIEDSTPPTYENATLKKCPSIPVRREISLDKVWDGRPVRLRILPAHPGIGRAPSHSLGSGLTH